MPYFARYKFPDQTTKNQKRTMKFNPVNNQAVFSSGSTVRFQLPSTGYLNPANTYLRFNARIVTTAGAYARGTEGSPNTAVQGAVEFQQGIESIFRRRRLTYANTPWEDFQDANILSRIFIEALCPSGSNTSISTMIQGIGPSKRFYSLATTLATSLTPSPFHWNYLRSNYHATSVNEVDQSNGLNDVGSVARAYAIPINFGLFQQKNLIPLQYMAGQLTLEYEIADAVDCVVWAIGNGSSAAVPTSCRVDIANVELVTELLNFDAAFEEAVFRILKTGGLPLFFQSWHGNSYSITPNNRVQIQIQESARSVRYALAVIVDDAFRTLRKDAHAFLSGWTCTQNDQQTFTTTAGINPNAVTCTNGTLLRNYQWRLGGAYYPNQPVQVYGGDGATVVSKGIDADYADPPVELYLELMKTFGNMFANEGTWFGDQGMNFSMGIRRGVSASEGCETSGLIMAVNFTSDRGDVITGLNAEEQNDLALIMNFNGTTNGTNKTVKTFVCFDNLVILGTSNNAVLIN